MSKSDEKQTYLMRKNWHTTLKALDDQSLGAVIRAIMGFVDGEECEVDNPLLNAIALGYIAELQRDKDSYDETCAKRAEAGSKGGKQKQANATEGQANLANATFATENQANLADKDRDRDKDKDRDKDIEKEKVKEKTDYQLIADMYNDTCVSFPTLKSLSESRKKAIRARLNRYSVDDFKALFVKAEASDFLKGANNRNWSATFDWLINDNNMTKVLDGNYDNKAAPKKGKANFEGRKYDFDALEKEALGYG